MLVLIALIKLSAEPGLPCFRTPDNSAFLSESINSARCIWSRAALKQLEANLDIVGSGRTVQNCLLIPGDFRSFLRPAVWMNCPARNILKGDMVWVGPRPIRSRKLCVWQIHASRYSVKPGLTGLWQVSGRSKYLSRRVQLDLDYIFLKSLARSQIPAQKPA